MMWLDGHSKSPLLKDFAGVFFLKDWRPWVGVSMAAGRIK